MSATPVVCNKRQWCARDCYHSLEHESKYCGQDKRDGRSCINEGKTVMAKCELITLKPVTNHEPQDRTLSAWSDVIRRNRDR